MFKDSKKNEGLSGAAVFSDSVIMPLKILIVLAVCIRQLWANPALAHLALPGWKELVLSDWNVPSPRNEEGWAHAGC